MISAWWWAGIGVSAVGAAVLAVVDRALRLERLALREAIIEVDRARTAVCSDPAFGTLRTC